MNLRIVTLLVWLCLSCLAVSCRSQAAQEKTDSVTFANTGSLTRAMAGVERISFHPTARVVEPVPGQSSKALRFTTEKAIREVFEASGYRFVPAGQGERELAYAIGASGELSDRELQRVFGISAGLGESREEGRGGLVMAVLNPKVPSVLWRFGGSGASRSDSTAEENTVRVRSAVQEFLAELPVRSRQ